MIKIKDSLTKEEMEAALQIYYYFFCKLYGLSFVGILPVQIEFTMHPKKWVNRHDSNLALAINAVRELNTRPEMKAIVVEDEQGIEAIARIKIDSEYLSGIDQEYAAVNQNRGMSICDICFRDTNRNSQRDCATRIIETAESFAKSSGRYQDPLIEDSPVTMISLEIPKGDEDIWNIAHELGYVTTDELIKESQRFRTILLEKNILKPEDQIMRTREKGVN